MAHRDIVPALLGFGGDWWTAWDYPERIMDQCFGNQLFTEDLLTPTFYLGYPLYPRTKANIAASGHSEVKNDKKEFKVSLNVKQFKPEEIEVKIIDDFIVIRGKHEEISEENGSSVSREFSRKYMLPKICELEKVTSSFNPSEGILEILAPKKPFQPLPKDLPDIPMKVDHEKSVDKMEDS